MTKKVAKNTSYEPIMSFKGFDKNLSCCGFEFEVGKSYTIKGVTKACENGFHACEHPFDVWGYYPPGESRFALVEQSGDLSRHADDRKVASASITIKAELSLPEFVSRGVEYILSKVVSTKVESNTGDRSAATNTGYLQHGLPERGERWGQPLGSSRLRHRGTCASWRDRRHCHRLSRPERRLVNQAYLRSESRGARHQAEHLLHPEF